MINIMILIIIILLIMIYIYTYNTSFVGSSDEPIKFAESIKICDGYLDALQIVPDSIIPRGRYGFNMSMVKYNNKYICAVRYATTKKGLSTNDIVPGNKYHPRVSSIGTNFIWGEWHNKNNVDATVFFSADFDSESCTLNNVSDVKYIHNIQVNSDNSPYRISLADIRLANVNNKLYMYDSMVTLIKELDINKEPLDQCGYYNNNICKVDYYKKYDKNWALIDESAAVFTFLHWFESDGVYVVDIDKTSNKCTKRRMVTFAEDPIPALGNQYLPMFSFTTPAIQTKHGLLSVGHIKILTTYKYDTNSKIHNARQMIRKKMSAHGNYIEHRSYIYLAYFILMVNNKMFISDAFIPLTITPDNYVFSIIFPMSLILIDESHLLLVGGYGDWCNIMIKFKQSAVINACIHDVEHFNAGLFDYHIIV